VSPTRREKGALEVELGDQELQRIGEALPQPAGARYDEAGMAAVNL
jgi:hypothetical protein